MYSKSASLSVVTLPISLESVEASASVSSSRACMYGERMSLTLTCVATSGTERMAENCDVISSGLTISTVPLVRSAKTPSCSRLASLPRIEMTEIETPRVLAYRPMVS